MKLKGALLSIIYFLLILTIVNARPDYNETGNIDNDFLMEEGDFGSVTVANLAIVTASNARQTPLVSDLDNNGINEIIILDSTTLRAFRNSTLTIIDTFATGLSGRTSNMIAFDIDGDGFKEIIISGEETEEIHIINFNNNSFTNQTIINFTGLTNHEVAAPGEAGEIIVKCREANLCGMAITDEIDQGTFATPSVGFQLFNSTSLISTTLTVQNESGTFVNYCFPYIKTMDLFDFDEDGDDEFIFVAGRMLSTTADQLNYYIVGVQSNLPVLEFQYNDTSRLVNVWNDNADECDDEEIGKRYSSPTVFPAQGGQTPVVLMNIMNALTTFKVIAYDSSGVEIDDFPEVFSGEADLVSNIAIGNFKPDTGDVDFCGAGYSSTSGTPQQMELICGSLISGDHQLRPQTERYEFNYSGRFNVSNTFGSFHAVIHSTNHDNERFSCLSTTFSCTSADLDEIITPLGLFKLRRETTGGQFDINNCKDFGRCDLQEVFNNPFSSGSMLSVDVEKTGAEDLILLSDSLVYFDDQFQNLPPSICEGTTECIILNPCNNQGAWQTNTSVSVTFDVFDDEQDDVTARALIYADSDNEQVLEEANVSTGADGKATFSFLFSGGANRTAGTAILRVEAFDNVNPSSVTEVETTFQVADTGLEFGDCSNTIEGSEAALIPVAETLEGLILQESELNNSVTAAVVALSGITGLAGSLIWIIAMLVLAFVIYTTPTFFNPNQNNPIATLIAIGIFESFMVFLGVAVGALSVAFVVILMVIIIFFIGLFVARVLINRQGVNNG